MHAQTGHGRHDECDGHVGMVGVVGMGKHLGGCRVWGKAEYRDPTAGSGARLSIEILLQGVEQGYIGEYRDPTWNLQCYRTSIASGFEPSSVALVALDKNLRE